MTDDTGLTLHRGDARTGYRGGDAASGWVATCWFDNLCWLLESNTRGWQVHRCCGHRAGPRHSLVRVRRRQWWHRPRLHFL